MTDAAPPAAKPIRPQFTLRRMLKWVFVVALVLGIGRWVYVRTYLQRQIAQELGGLEAHVQYAWIFEPTLPGHGTWIGNDSVLPGRVIKVVGLPVPFRSDDEPHRVNQMLRQLPHLVDVRAEVSRFRHDDPNRSDLADHHFAAAIAGLRLRGVMIQAELGQESISAICDSSSITAVEFNHYGLPPPEQFQSICSATHVTHIAGQRSLTSKEYVRILASTQHLRFLRLSWYELDESIEHEDLAALGRLPNCDLEVLAQNVSDGDLRDCIAKLPNLTRLQLLFEAPSDDAVAALARTPRLRHLSLQDATVSDEAIIAHADSPSLEQLSVGGTDVSEEAIVQLHRCKTLRWIHAPEKLDFRRLVAALPGVEISTLPTPPGHAKFRAERRASAEAARAADATESEPSELMSD